MGTIEQLSIKPRTPRQPGLPKREVPELLVDEEGAAGDFNRYRTRELPGDREQAVLVITREMLDRLRAEGWPVGPGDLGENLTLAGVAESALVPGVRLRSGSVELEITKACDPCTEVYTLPYIGGERGPAFVRALVGRRGWYARVLAPGVLHRHGAVEVVPPGAARVADDA